ncbi:MAG: glycosyltransferase, partial [Chloroflexia bacterium]
LVRRLIKRHNPDLVLIEHIMMAQYLPGDSSDWHLPPVLLSDHDVRAGAAQVHRVPRRLAAWLTMLEERRWQRYKRLSWRRVQAVLVPSAEDAAVILRSVSDATVEIVPFGLAPRDLSSTNGLVRDDSTLLFVGNFDHPPNRDAALRLGNGVFPIVAKSRPDTRLLLVGKNPTPDIEALAANDERITVTGEVESVEPYLRGCALFVAPLTKGGGVRIKLLEAMSAGIPVITTPLGVHGLGAQPGRHLLVASDDGEFAQAIVGALSDHASRARLAAQAYALVAGPERTAMRAQRLNDVLQRFAK